MSTPEQIEAVARAICASAGSCHPEDVAVERDHIHYFQDATAAIAAYEATRPAVGDEELAALYKTVYWAHGTLDGAHIAAVRAVRSRLEAQP